MQYSPKLKTAMEEIKAILKKHDIAGIVCLHTPGFQEYLNKLDPSYSALTLQEDRFQIKGHSKHYFGNKELRDQKLAETRNMVDHFSKFAGIEFMMFDQIEKQMDATWGKWDTDEGDHTSHNQQNN